MAFSDETFGAAIAYTNKKIDSALTEGISEAVEDQAPAMVNDYCEEHFSEWEGALDDTFTQSNMAAPAKATGDAVNDLKSALTSIEEDGGITYSIETEIGYFDSSGADSYNDNTHYRRTKYIDLSVVDAADIVNSATALGALVYALYDSQKEIIGERQSISGAQPIDINNANFLRIAGYATGEATEERLLSSISITYKKSYTQQLADRVAEVENDITVNQIVADKSFTMAANASHSAANDRVTVNLQIGEMYAVMVSSDITSGVWTASALFNGEGTAQVIGRKDFTNAKNNVMIFVADKVTNTIGIGVSAQTASHNVTFYVYKVSGLPKKYVRAFETSTSAHSSTIGTTDTIFEKGFPVRVDLDCAIAYQNISWSVLVWYEGSNTGVSVGSKKMSDPEGNFIVFYPAQKVVKMGIYTAAGQSTWYTYSAYNIDSYYPYPVFSQTINTGHSSNNDRMEVGVPKGKKVAVGINPSEEMKITWALYALYSGDESTTQVASGNLEYLNGNVAEFTAEKDIVTIGFYLSGLSGTQKPVTCWLKFVDDFDEQTISKLKELQTFDTNYPLDLSVSDAVKAVSAHYDGTTDSETLIFFSDPHNVSNANNYTEDDVRNVYHTMNKVKQYQDCCNVAGVFCGGDILSYGDSKAIAAYKMMNWLGIAHDLLHNFHFVLGNHDTNEQGQSQAAFTKDELANMYFGNENTKKCYYTTMLNHTKMVCLDTGSDTDPSVITDYAKAQIHWFCELLLANDINNLMVVQHIFSVGYQSTDVFESGITAFANKIVDVIDAFNDKTTLTYDGQTYDFSNAVGTVHCILCGHTHYRYTYYCASGLPVIVETAATNYGGTNMNFDVMFADYTNKKLYCKASNGTDYDREVTLV